MMTKSVSRTCLAFRYFADAADVGEAARVVVTEKEKKYGFSRQIVVVVVVVVDFVLSHHQI